MSKPHASLPHDRDPQLEALRREMRAIMASLNDLHHPVIPGDPRRIAALEAQVASLRTAIAERRQALAKHARV